MNREDIFNVIKTCVIDVLPEMESHTFRDGDTLEELGANSMNKADIIMLTLEELSLNIPRIEVFGPKSVGDLADLLYGKFHK